MSVLIIVAVGEDHQQYELGVLFRLGRVLGVREPGLRVIIPFARTNKIEHPRDGNRNPRLQRAGGDRRRHGISGVMEAISEIEHQRRDNHDQDDHVHVSSFDAQKIKTGRASQTE